jgi:hypothetical protein
VSNFGRFVDEQHTEEFYGKQPQIMQAAADIMLEDDDKDVDLCLIYEAATGRKWNSLNQNPRGFCVGFGNAKGATLAVAMSAHAGEISDPGADVAVEPIYGGSRYEIGTKKHGSNIASGGDGSVGSWAAEWLLEYGLLLKMKYPELDLSKYSLSRCDEMGRRGVPDSIEPTAKLHPIKAMTRVDTGEQSWKMQGQLYPLIHCSNIGFTMQRDSKGRCRRSGSWAHCWLWSGRFTLDGNQYLRGDNSWDGTESGSGYLANSPITVNGDNGPINLNGNQFLVALEDVDHICRTGKETYAPSGPKGFEKRRELFLI